MLMDKIKLLLITILFMILSPWFFSFVMFPERFNPNNLTFSTINDQLFIDNINYLQGITRDSSLTFPSRLVVNKYTMYLKKLINNYFETYDPKYLYFEGEDDLTKTPYAAGPLLVGTFSFFAIGIAKSIKKHKYIIDTLKTADALDRFRLPKSDWWPKDEYLVRIPSLGERIFAYNLVVRSEELALSGLDNTTSVKNALKQ